MRNHEARLQALEAARQPTRHHTPVQAGPEEPPCPCGQAACPQHSIGLKVPAPLDPDNWDAAARAFFAHRTEARPM